MRSYLLGPWVWRVHCQSPTSRVVRVCIRAAQGVARGQNPLSVVNETIDRGELVERPDQSSLGRSAVIAENENQKRIVGQICFFEEIDEPTDLGISMRCVTCIEFH